MKKVFFGFLLLFISVVTLSLVPLKAATPIGTSFNFTIETKMGENEATVTDLGSKNYGSTVTIDGGSLAASGYTFVTYIVNEKVESSLPAGHTFTVTSDLEVTALYKPDNTVMVAFMDANQDMLSVQYVASGASATPPDVSGLSKPGLEVSVSTPWSGSYSNVTEDSVLWVVYERSISETYSLTVNNGTGAGTYNYNDVATVTANGTGTFQYWYMNGNIVSLQQSYSFTVLDDTEITAVYTGEATGTNPESLFISLSDPYAIKTSYSTYLGQFYLPSGHEMVEFGLLASNTPGDITLATDGVEKIRSDKFNASTGEFVRSLLDSTYSSKNIRAYMITSNEGVLTETYSFVNENLFISEYGEGRSNNKWIEIYNPNDYSVDLSNYELLLFTNGATTGGSSPDFSGVSIGSKDVLVYYNSSSAIGVSENGDYSSGVANFNGDDAIALYKDGFIIDQFGVIGTDPGSSWVVGSEDTADNTLVRKSTIVSSNPIWDTTEWDVYPIDTFDYIGNHNPSAPASITITGETTVMDGATINLSVTYPVNTIEGVTWESSNELVATVNSSGVVTGVSEGTVTITATSTADTNISDTHSVEVTAPVTYTVYFDDNEADENQVSNQTGILSGSAAVEPNPAPGKTGFVFGGWYEDEGTWLEPFDFQTLITEDIYLYAKWDEEGSVTYSTDLFISEYIEGGSFNKAIEIYNGTGADVDLSAYSLKINTNANKTWGSTVLNLSGTLAAGDVLVIYNSQANAAIASAGDIVDNTIANFNGDDAIGLFKNDVLIDLFGVFGEDPGSSWPVGTGTTADYTLVRKATVTAPTTTWDPTEWDVYPKDTTDYIGSHSFNPE